MLDVKRKAPWFWSDFRDGLSLQCLASILFLYCACMSPVITFGGLLGEATNGHIVSTSRRWAAWRGANSRQSPRCSESARDPLIPRWVSYPVLPLPPRAERHGVAAGRVHDRRGVLPLCWPTSHHPRQHRTRPRVREDPLQILQVRPAPRSSVAAGSPRGRLSSEPPAAPSTHRFGLVSQGLRALLSLAAGVHRAVDLLLLRGAGGHRRQLSGVLHHPLHRRSLRRPHLHHLHL